MIHLIELNCDQDMAQPYLTPFCEIGKFKSQLVDCPLGFQLEGGNCSIAPSSKHHHHHHHHHRQQQQQQHPHHHHRNLTDNGSSLPSLLTKLALSEGLSEVLTKVDIVVTLLLPSFQRIGLDTKYQSFQLGGRDSIMRKDIQKLDIPRHPTLQYRLYSSQLSL